MLSQPISKPYIIRKRFLMTWKQLKTDHCWILKWQCNETISICLRNTLRDGWYLSLIYIKIYIMIFIQFISRKWYFWYFYSVFGIFQRDNFMHSRVTSWKHCMKLQKHCLSKISGKILTSTVKWKGFKTVILFQTFEKKLNEAIVWNEHDSL